MRKTGNTHQGRTMMWASVAGVALTLTASGIAGAQAPPLNPIVLVDSTGKVAARALNETLMLVNVGGGVVAPAFIRPIYDGDGRTASGLATWQSSGSVLFTSSDCTTGAHVHGSPHAGVRATAQVQTPSGIVLHVGTIGMATTMEIHSILYDTGCAAVSVRQYGLFPVVVTVNLDAAYPPPLSFQ